MNKEELRQYSAKLLWEKEKLQQRINKAIEYIENTQTITNAGEKTLNNTGYGIRLLEILKGESNER